MRALPEPFTVVIQPQSVMADTWGATFAWPRKEIWLAARDPAEMTKTLLPEVAHARLPAGEQHSPRWEAECRRLWREVFGDREGFQAHIACYVGK